jgi:hypothetical protein
MQKCRHALKKSVAAKRLGMASKHDLIKIVLPVLQKHERIFQ